MKTRLLSLFLLTASMLPFAVQAEDAPPPAPAAEASAPLQSGDRERVERYLTNIHSITSDFVQIAPDGNVTSGKVFIKRPNKMRWVYDPPTPVLMVTRGNFLTYYDFELKQVSDIPLDSTLLSFFAMDKVKFGETVKVVGTERAAGILRMKLQQSDNPSLGQLTLEFADNPLTLHSFIIRDAQGKTTSVTLNKARFDEDLDDSIFEFIDPRTKGRMKQRSGTDAQ